MTTADASVHAAGTLSNVPYSWGVVGVITVAALVSTAIIPLLIRHAARFGLVDEPDGHRKQQKKAVPLGGGIGVVLAIFVALGLAYLSGTAISQELVSHTRFMLGLAGATALICCVGLLDDVYEIRGRQKLAGQMVAIVMIVSGGLVIRQVDVAGWRIELGLLAIPITMCWLVGAINAVNLIDGVDGLAGTVGVILAVTIATLCELGGRSHDALYAWALAGGLIGFIVYNWTPAKIYLGDAGSMAVGLILGALAIRASFKETATLVGTVPLVVWAVLFFDVVMAVLRRTLTGRSIYATDRSHFHHVLQQRGLSVPVVVGLIASSCFLCCLGAVGGVVFRDERIGVIAAVLVFAVLIGTGLFGRSEVALLLRRALNTVLSLGRFPSAAERVRRPMTSHLHGNRAWEELWQELVDYSERFDLGLVQLNVSAPAIGEEYHAMWERKSEGEARAVWRAEVPLIVREIAVGQLIVSGWVAKGSCPVEWMAELVAGLKPFQVQMESFLEGAPRPTATERSLGRADAMVPVNGETALGSIAPTT